MKGERRGKKKTKFSVLTMPNRLFSSEKIMKGEHKNSPYPAGKGI